MEQFLEERERGETDADADFGDARGASEGFGGEVEKGGGQMREGWGTGPEAGYEEEFVGGGCEGWEDGREDLGAGAEVEGLGSAGCEEG